MGIWPTLCFEWEVSESVCWGGHSPVLVPEEEPLLLPEYWWGSWRGSSEPGKYYGNTGIQQHTLTEVQMGLTAFGFQMYVHFCSYQYSLDTMKRSGYIENLGFHMTVTCRLGATGVCKETKLVMSVFY